MAGDNAGNAPVFADKNHVERNARVPHPEADFARRVKHKQHAGIGCQMGHMHEPARMARPISDTGNRKRVACAVFADNFNLVIWLDRSVASRPSSELPNAASGDTNIARHRSRNGNLCNQPSSNTAIAAPQGQNSLSFNG